MGCIVTKEVTLDREISQVKLHSFFDSDEYRLNSSIFFKGDVLWKKADA